MLLFEDFLLYVKDFLTFAMVVVDSTYKDRRVYNE